MNEIHSLIGSLADDELKQVVVHLKIVDNCEVVPPGALRYVVGRLAASLRMTEQDALGHVRYAVLERAARKWAGVPD